MLGLDEARAYLEREHIPPVAPTRALPPALPAACRRRNGVHDAIVEAALKIEMKFGSAAAFALLKDEQVPEAVAARILAQGPRQIRARRAQR